MKYEDLPEKIELIPEDKTGQYADPDDCPLARALGRYGFSIKVGSWGKVREISGSYIAKYSLKGGTEFWSATAENAAILVKTPLN